MRNIEDLAAEEDSRIWEERSKVLRVFLLWLGSGSEIWGWYLFSQPQIGKGALFIIASFVFFGLAWGILRVFSNSTIPFVLGLASGLGGFAFYSYSRLPSFYWGHDPSFWLSVQAGAVTEPFWSPLSYLLAEAAGFLLPQLQFSFLPELSGVLLSITLFFILQVYFSELQDKTFRNVLFALLICVVLGASAPFWNSGTMGAGIPSVLGLLIFILQSLLFKKEGRPWRGLAFLLGLLWSVHPLWGLVGTLNYLGFLDFEGKKLRRYFFPFLLGLTPYLWILFRTGKYFPSWGGRQPFLEMLKEWKSLWLFHVAQDWIPLEAFKALGLIALVLGAITILGFLLYAFKWKSGWKIQLSVMEFWIWVFAGVGGWFFYSVSTELLGPTILWFLAGLGNLLLKLFEKCNSSPFTGKLLTWFAPSALVLSLSLVFFPGQNFWRSQFYFPPQHAMNLLQTLGEKSLLICQDPFEAAACMETRLMEPAAPNSMILEQKYLNQKWYITQVMAHEPGILFSIMPEIPQDIPKTLILDNSSTWDIQWDLSVLPKGWTEPVGVPTVLTEEFAGNPATLLDPERFQYRFDLAAMPIEGLTGDAITRNYYSRYVIGFDELGKFLMGLGRYSDSIRAFDRSLKLDPSFQEPQTFLAQMYSQKNILEAAQLEFEKIIHVQPDKISVLMGRIEEAQKDKDESEIGLWLDQMIQLNSELANAEYQLSKIYEKEGRTQEAKTMLESSVNMNPQQLGAQITLGHLMKKLGNRIKAQEAFHSALVIDPQNKEAQVEYWKLLNNQ